MTLTHAGQHGLSFLLRVNSGILFLFLYFPLPTTWSTWRYFKNYEEIGHLLWSLYSFFLGMAGWLLFYFVFLRQSPGRSKNKHGFKTQVWGSKGTQHVSIKKGIVVILSTPTLIFFPSPSLSSLPSSGITFSLDTFIRFLTWRWLPSPYLLPAPTPELPRWSFRRGETLHILIGQFGQL